MKNSNYLIIGAIILGVYFLLRKKPIVTTLEKPLVTPNNEKPLFVYPVGITEGMKVLGNNSDGTQYLIQQGKKYGITFEQWVSRGYDPYIIVDQLILNSIPDGGLLNNGLI
jgi:hypothetical protein